jgi:hypothetical protein
VYLLNKLGDFPPSTSVMSQDLALQQGMSQLQISSEDLWTFSIYILSRLFVTKDASLDRWVDLLDIH